MKIILSTIILFTSLFVGCKTDLDMSLVPKKQLEFTKTYLEVIRKKEFQKLDSVLAPNLNIFLIEKTFTAIDSIFPSDEDPEEVLLLGSNNIKYPDSSTTEISFQYKFSKNYAVGDLFLVTKNDEIRIAGIHINPIKESFAKVNAFTLNGKSLTHFLFLFLSLSIAVVIIISLIFCLKSKIKKKWLWVIFILVGFGKIVLNWTTGGISYSIIAFQLLGFGITSSGQYAPWFVALSIPLGAIIFLIKRKKLIESNKLVQEVI